MYIYPCIYTNMHIYIYIYIYIYIFAYKAANDFLILRDRKNCQDVHPVTSFFLSFQTKYEPPHHLVFTAMHRLYILQSLS
jgi:hypothetical protein